MKKAILQLLKDLFDGEKWSPDDPRRIPKPINIGNVISWGRSYLILDLLLQGECEKDLIAKELKKDSFAELPKDIRREIERAFDIYRKSRRDAFDEAGKTLHYNFNEAECWGSRNGNVLSSAAHKGPHEVRIELANHLNRPLSQQEVIICTQMTNVYNAARRG